MEQKSISRVFSDYFSSLSFNVLSDAVVQKTKNCIIDMLECVYSANNLDSRIESSMNTINRSLMGECRIWGTNDYTNAEDAAFINALKAASSYRNSLHRASGNHPVEIVAAAAISAAVKNNKRLSDVILGIVCGVEIISRIGKLLINHDLSSALRKSALCGVFGATVAAAKVMGLSSLQMKNAIALSTHFGFGTNQWGLEGTGEDVFHAGFAAKNGYICASLAKNGAEGSDFSIEGIAGFCSCYGLNDSIDITQNLGVKFAIEEIEFKVIEACLMTQTPAQIINNYLAENSIAISDIKHIVVGVCKQAKNQPGCDSLTVTNAVQAKMNIRYVIASLLFGNNINQIVWYPPYNSNVLFFMKKIEIKEEKDFSLLFPKKVSARIRIDTYNGKSIELFQEDFSELPFEKVVQRLSERISNITNKSKVDCIISSINDNMVNISDIVKYWN